MIIIKKILEITETETTETFQLICHEKDEGWELTREEMEKLRTMTERSLEDFYGRRERETVPAELYDDLYRKYNLACLKIKAEFHDDQAEECPDFIEPPESTETVEKVQNEVENVPKPAEKEQKEVKKAQKRAGRDFSKYADMEISGVDQKTIRETIKVDFQISNLTADNYYYTKVRPLAQKKKNEVDAQQAERTMEVEKKQLERKLQKKINTDPLTEDLASLPDYGSYSDFKDMCSMMDIGRGKHSLQKLKEIYLNTHPNIKW